MVGQGHVVRALSNALDQDRLHHAYLFTGTRGVGKTTLARILSKALNCEEGISATPCGCCSACSEIDEGRFVDLLEVDAASRTKVDQTRELLDNVPFAPVKGRFKVYLIDEVHMFSASSFNALLKTLEEPPQHVKFLLATTDPQKVPVTVLSRCLQFNLKRLVPEEICSQLDHILKTERIAFEEQALTLLARAADGSMRDGLSLLDQAIAYSGGRVGVDEVRAMLGTVSRDKSLNLVRALAQRDGAGLLDEVARIHQLIPDFDGLLQDVLLLLHRIALYQQVPETLPEDDPEREDLVVLAQTMDAEDVQLYYQIALLGQQDLLLAPDSRTGLEMVLLRMLAFRPAEIASDGYRPDSGAMRAAVSAIAAPNPVPAGGSRGNPAARAGASPQPYNAPPSPAEIAPRQDRLADPGTAPVSAVGHPASVALAAARLAVASDKPTAKRHSAQQGSGPVQQATQPPVVDPGWVPQSPLPPSALPCDEVTPARHALRVEPDGDEVRQGQRSTKEYVGGSSAPKLQHSRLDGREDWHALVDALGLGGVTSELARNCELNSWDGHRLVLVLDPTSQRLRVDVAEQRLRESLRGALGEGLALEIRVSRPQGETPSQRRAREQAEQQAAAEAAMEVDPVVQTLRSELGARLISGTVAPTPTDSPPSEAGGQ